MSTSSFFREFCVGGRVDRLHLVKKPVEVNSPPPAPRAMDLHQIGELIHVDRKGISGEFHEVGTFPSLDRAKIMIPADLEGGIHCVGQ